MEKSLSLFATMSLTRATSLPLCRMSHHHSSGISLAVKSAVRFLRTSFSSFPRTKVCGSDNNSISNSLVLSDSQRAAVTDPVIAKLVPLIPRSNFVDSTGNSRFVGSANATVNADQWSFDVAYNLGSNDRLHGFYDVFRTSNIEPNRNGNTIPGFGNTSRQLRQVLTLNETTHF